MSMKKLLWLDDSRNPHENDWLVFSPIPQPFETIWVKSYDEFMAWIEANGLPDAICFDHDLSLMHYANDYSDEKTGYDCAKWLVNHCLNNSLMLPDFASQSANPVGRENILKYLKSAKRVIINDKRQRQIKELALKKDRAGLEAMGIYLPETFYKD